MTEPLITSEQLHAILPLAGARADLFAPLLADAMLRFEVNTPTRVAAFLAQVGHESGQLRLVREIWGPTPAQHRYEGNKNLGNTHPGDGKRFLGRGLIQITGRKNYAACGAALKFDLLAYPELLEQPANAALSAGWFWQSNNLNRFADTGNFVGLTKAINGGINGIADRRALWSRAKTTLGAS